jgi:hypothetical protein
VPSAITVEAISQIGACLRTNFRKSAVRAFAVRTKAPTQARSEPCSEAGMVWSLPCANRAYHARSNITNVLTLGKAAGRMKSISNRIFVHQLLFVPQRPA